MFDYKQFTPVFTVANDLKPRKQCIETINIANRKFGLEWKSFQVSAKESCSAQRKVISASCSTLLQAGWVNVPESYVNKFLGYRSEDENYSKTLTIYSVLKGEEQEAVFFYNYLRY